MTASLAANAAAACFQLLDVDGGAAIGDQGRALPSYMKVIGFGPFI